MLSRVLRRGRPASVFSRPFSAKAVFALDPTWSVDELRGKAPAPLDRDTFVRVAKLSRLSVDPDSPHGLAVRRDLGNILSSVAHIKDVADCETQPDESPSTSVGPSLTELWDSERATPLDTPDRGTRFRYDSSSNGPLPREALLESAPAVSSGYFAVPKVLGEEE
jgi:Asp-tRNA(Asn)/Glu-tRNA(Gln) amidotransferase C subunit